jgi:hypothetical protein
MPNPACVKCGKFMEKTAIGVHVAEMAKTTAPKPYQVWSADVFTCFDCKFSIVGAYAERPFWCHWHEAPTPIITHAIWER